MTVTMGNELSTSVAFTTTSPFTASFNGGTNPEGAMVWVVQTGDSTDHISGVTYGGVAMTRIDTAFDTVGEPGGVYLYFLGSGVPTGSQNISITHDGAATEKRAFWQTVQAAANVEVKVSGKLQGDQADPQIALDSGGDETLRFACIFSGQTASSGLTIISGMSSVRSQDFGPQVTRVDRQTTASTGSFTIGWTATSDDVAMLAVAIGEDLGEDIVRIISPN